MSLPNSRHGTPAVSSTDTSPSSEPLQLTVVTSTETALWRPILTGPNLQVVLYNPTSHALVLRPQSPTRASEDASLPVLQRRPSPPRAHDQNEFGFEHSSGACPYCGQPFPSPDEHQQQRAPDYFRLLAASHESESIPGSPNSTASTSSSQHRTGYFDKFFRTEKRLGMGASGAVFLVQHVIDGAELGRFAVKKIAVGESRPYLIDMLREVQLLETLHHPNIVIYHHAWLEDTQWSSFQPAIQTLHILMQWADAGSLDDLIDARIGISSDGGTSSTADDRAARIRAHRLRQKHRGDTRAVHYFSAGEVRSIFTDIVQGLGFLHDRSILHLDLKPGNVLLSFDDGLLIPRAMLSDFGTSQDALRSGHIRTGNTGTLEYSAPETLSPSTPTGVQSFGWPGGPATTSLPPLDSKADMWSLGMILHKMVFFRLPWMTGQPASEMPDAGLGPARVRHADSGGLQTELEEEIRKYRGFIATPTQRATIAARGLPAGLAPLLESLLHISARTRPTCERVLAAVHGSHHQSSERREHSRSPVAHTRPLASSPSPPDSGSAVIVRTSSATATPGSLTPPEDITPALALPALEWNGELVTPPEEAAGDLDILTQDMLVTTSAQSPDMAPGMVLEVLAGRVARCALLATKIYTLTRAQPSSTVTAFLAVLASVDLWPGLVDERGAQASWFRRPTIQRELLLAAMHFGVLHAWQM